MYVLRNSREVRAYRTWEGWNCGVVVESLDGEGGFG